MKIALTGGIACGKSLLVRYLNEFGVETIDADDIVHELIPDPAERRRIAAEVFADPAKRRELEARIHPLVKARIEEFFEKEEVKSKKEEVRSKASRRSRSTLLPSSFFLFPSPNLRIAIIPLLFETHWDAEYDIICTVASTRDIQLSRMVQQRGYSREEAEARLAAQLPVDEKAAKSQYVINNNGTKEELKAKAKIFVEWLKTTERQHGQQ